MGVSSHLDKGMAFLSQESRTTDYDSRRTWDSGLDAGSTPARSIYKKSKIGVVYADRQAVSSMSSIFIVRCILNREKIGHVDFLHDL